MFATAVSVLEHEGYFAPRWFSFASQVMGKEGFAATSLLPGETRAITFYCVQQALHLVDLPGYGFAHATEEKRQEWLALMRSYFSQRRQLRHVFVLVDAQNSLKPIGQGWLLAGSEGLKAVPGAPPISTKPKNCMFDVISSPKHPGEDVNPSPGNLRAGGRVWAAGHSPSEGVFLGQGQPGQWHGWKRFRPLRGGYWVGWWVDCHWRCTDLGWAKEKCPPGVTR